MEEELPEMKFFVLPGGNKVVSHAHVARCICRRAERLVVELMQNSFVDPMIESYMNRLSDYLFVLSRKLTQDFNAIEIPWHPKMEG
jgi:cob(I)alamin adenosyltransferase